MKTSLQSIEHLGRFERLQLAEDLWDEFAQQDQVDISTEVLDELERRSLVTWSVVFEPAAEAETVEAVTY
jgi:hypothetical protein